MDYRMPAVTTRRTLRLAYLGDPNETHTRRWVGWFADHGHEVSIVVPADLALESPLPAGIRLVRMAAYGGRTFRPLGYLDGRAAVRSAVRALDPDLLHVHYLTGYGWLAWISGFRPYAITVWGSDVFRTLPASRKARWLGRLALRGAALVTADSHDLAEGAIAGGARRDRTREIQFGVDTTRFSPGPPDAALRHRLGLPDGRLVFSARTLIGFYRHDVVLRALATLPGDVVLLLSARHADPATRARIEALTAELGIGGRVVIVEDIAHGDMADVIRLADVVVSVPETDGTPVTILETLAAGRPVVASDVPSVREWLGPLAPDRLVPVGDVAATATAIRRVLETPAAEVARLAAAGRAVVTERADHDANMRAVEAACYRLAGDRVEAAGAATAVLP
jgi:glycosyltransferase involved in cell wall biosynthesis